jgi:hypothetical protein
MVPGTSQPVPAGRTSPPDRGRPRLRWALLTGTAIILVLYLLSAWAWIDLTIPPLKTWITLAGGRVWINHDSYLPSGWAVRAEWGGPGWGWWWHQIPFGAKKAWGIAIPAWWILAPAAAGAALAWSPSRRRPD